MIKPSKDDKKSGKDGKKLPNTATDNYNYLILGLILLFAGIAMYFVKRRKVAGN
ncbi:MAG: LPXTG cell wall anchor domain-containing protein [Anaerobacillus sp.]|uniref:LPXTG cell wall anchor domain-containing protein n=1 Tax=Anaerobacillus sp. TaxID=1872506 RepID=UPI003919167A